MQKSKKLFALLLSVLMILGTVSATVISGSAKSFDDVAPESQFSEQIEILSDMGIILGTSENEFSPNANVSREQMAMLLYRLMTGKDNAGRINTSPFTDLYEPVYNGAISWANANGFIYGTTVTTFNPRGGITLQDALAMVTRALGQTNDKTAAGYPWSYIDIGTRIGLTNGLEKVEYTDTLTRAQTAALLFNALTADYIVANNTSGTTVTRVTTVLSEVYGYKAGVAQIVATNNASLTPYDKVVKNGYVLALIDGTPTHVLASDLGIKDDVTSHIGEQFTVFYKTNATTGISSVLASAKYGKTEKFNSFSYDTGKTYVKIGDVKYKVVENYSNATATNANELIVYMVQSNGTYTKVASNEALIALEGYFTIKMISDGATSRTAVFTPLSIGELKITNGAINIAGNKTTNELTGGFVNANGAQNGDYVLYNYGADSSRLVIEHKLEVVKGVQVSRKTATTAVVGGKTYQLGVTGTSQNASAVHSSLNVGDTVNLVVFGNSIIAAYASGNTASSSYNYLIATSDLIPVVYNGKIVNYMTAFVGGGDMGVHVSNSSVTVGQVYRYTEKDGVLTLVAPDASEFASSDAIKTVINSASSVTIGKGSNVYFTLSGSGADLDFITDSDTIIIVKTANGYVYRRGVLSSDIRVVDGARVVAVAQNCQGDIEKLDFLYVSNGSIDTATSLVNYVTVLSSDGSELVDGKALYVYNVYNFANGKIQAFYSESSSLTPSKTYLLDEHGNISSTEKSLESGTVNGIAGNVITIGPASYTLASDVTISHVESGANGHTVKNLTATELYGMTVSFIANGSTITHIITIS